MGLQDLVRVRMLNRDPVVLGVQNKVVLESGSHITLCLKTVTSHPCRRCCTQNLDSPRPGRSFVFHAADRPYCRSLASLRCSQGTEFKQQPTNCKRFTITV